MLNLTYSLLELANNKNYRVLFFGATQEVNDQAIKEVLYRYPDIDMCKGINGYFTYYFSKRRVTVNVVGAV